MSAALSYRDRVGQGLEVLAEGLEPFVDEHMRVTVGADEEWADVFASTARPPLRDYSRRDPLFLLRVMIDCWRGVFESQFPRAARSSTRNLLFTVRDVRNDWAHNHSIGGYDALNALSGIGKLLAAVGVDEPSPVRVRLDELIGGLHQGDEAPGLEEASVEVEEGESEATRASSEAPVAIANEPPSKATADTLSVVPVHQRGAALPTSRIRIHQLANELRLSNEECLDLALTLGIAVKTHSSGIEQAQADRVRWRVDRDRDRPAERSDCAPGEISWPRATDRSRNVYKAVLAGLRSHAELDPGDDQSLADLLQSLTPALGHLREAYRPGQRNHVQAGYRDHAALAYLLGYYPQYVEQACALLQRIVPGQFADCTDLSISVFGAGPAPEVAALGSIIRAAVPSVETITVELLDVDNRGWRHARDISLNHVVPIFWAKRIKTRTTQLDLSADRWAHPELRAASADIVLLQNCINEVRASEEDFATNVRSLAERMRPGALIAIAGHEGYEPGHRLVAAAEAALAERAEVLHKWETDVYELRPTPPPPFVQEHFFRSDQNPRTQPYKWRYTALRIPDVLY
jgi:hypothetical protein